MKLLKHMSLEDIEVNFGKIEYRDLRDGWIEITNDFERRNIRRHQFGFLFKPVPIHKKIIKAVDKALHVIERNCAFDPEFEYIENMQFWAPRHIANNKKRRLSSHSWGIAFDINPWENMPGCANPAIPLKIVKVFKSVGFIWGGDWKSKDYMHFEPAGNFFDFEGKWT